MKNPFSLAITAALLAAPVLAQNQKPVKTIRVAPLVAEDPRQQGTADLMTAKLVSHLVEHGVTVVEGKADLPTDAILKATYIFRAGRFEGPVRLTDRGGRVIWADEAQSTRSEHSASSSFAEAVALKVEDFLFKQQQQR